MSQETGAEAALSFQEVTDSGFGDRLRGIAHLLHQAAVTGARRVYYNDDETCRDATERARAFPWRMTDLIRLEGLAFEHRALPLPATASHIVWDSLVDTGRLTRAGFPYMSRIRPRDADVDRRVRALHIDRTHIGFHVRRTDKVQDAPLHFTRDADRQTLRRVVRGARRLSTRKVFLAADNARSARLWGRALRRVGLQVTSAEPEYEPTRMRQTTATDMLVDFFGLAACGRVVRRVPSEFSRFAAWIGGRRLGYSDLD